MARKLLLLVLAVSLLLSVVPQGMGETGEYDETLRERQARLIWANMTAMQVNSSFPYVFKGSSSNGTETRPDYFAGAGLYYQTGNTTYLEKGQELAEYLTSSDVKNLLFNYDVSSGWQDGRLCSSAALKLAEFAVYCRADPSYLSLLQGAASEFISLFLNSSTYRIFDKVDYDGTVDSNIAGVGGQTFSIRALTLASDVLNNDTLREVAYRMIMNYTLGSANLPYHQIKQDGGAQYTGCKEDQTFGWYILSLCSYYRYFPNETVKERIKNVTMAFYKYGWNSGASRWNYKTNADTGATSSSAGVHGFGYTDEAFLQAYLIWQNTTWLDKMKQDMLTMISDSGLMENGIITHTTSVGSTDANDDWNVAARRTFALFYNFNYAGFYRNTTFLDYANQLFVNATLGHNRTLCWQMVIYATDFSDYYPSNTRGEFSSWLSYVNRTTATINSLDDLFNEFGGYRLGNTWGSIRYSFLAHPVVWESVTYNVITRSNSSVTDLTFEHPSRSLIFYVEGETDTSGYVNISIPKALLDVDPSKPLFEWTVYFDSKPLTTITQTTTETQTFIYLEYDHSKHQIRIMGNEAVPEFPSLVILPLLMLATILAALALKKKSKA